MLVTHFLCMLQYEQQQETKKITSSCMLLETLNYTFKDLTFIIHQGGEINRRFKTDRLVYVNKVYAIDGLILLSGNIQQLLIYHWYYQQEPTVTMSIIWHYFTLYSALVRMRPESRSRRHNSRKIWADWKGSKPGLQRWSQAGEHTLQEKADGVTYFFCGVENGPGGPHHSIPVLKEHLQRRQKLLLKESHGEGKWRWVQVVLGKLT